MIVVGAGASREFGLPDGNGLKEKIKQALSIDQGRSGSPSGNEHIFKSLKYFRQVATSNELVAAARVIANSMALAPSIDNFVHTHDGDERIRTVAKLAITRLILEEESRSKLRHDPAGLTGPYYEPSIDFEKLKGTWLDGLFKILARGKVSDFLDRLSGIAFVVFNYDRCIQQFFYNAVQYYFQLGIEETIDVLNSLEIHHVYGSVGGMYFENDPRNESFGASPVPERLADLSKRIRTFTEGIDPESGKFRAINRSLANAEQVIFLGFAFDDLNMKILVPRGDSSGVPGSVFAAERKIYGTTLGMSDVARRRANFEIARTGISALPDEYHRLDKKFDFDRCKTRHVSLIDSTAGELFRSHASVLTR